MKNVNSSRLAFAFAVFAALFPLTFSFHSGQPVTFFLDSPASGIWCSLVWGLSAYLLIHFRESLSRKKMIALAGLYLLVPCAFYWTGQGIHLIVWQANVWIALGMMMMAGLWIAIAARIYS